MEENKIKVQKEDGQEVEYVILHRFFSEEYQKEYVIYSDEIEDENGDVEILFSWYDKENDELVEIDDDDEWHEVAEKVLNL